MRIISGSKKGSRINVPKKVAVRPTTDFSKENIFNIINTRFHFADIHVLDLFSGSGNISFEFASRGCEKVVFVDKNYHSYKFIQKESERLGFKNISGYKNDALKFLIYCDDKFDIIFADPPYNYSGYHEIIEIIFDRNILKSRGLLIIEHSKDISLESDSHFSNLRQYGQSCFSFLEKP